MVLTSNAIEDFSFQQAVMAMDKGDVGSLEKILTGDSTLVRRRLETADEGYFKDPYLIWFIANNPIRQTSVPDSILGLLDVLLRQLNLDRPDSYQEQLNYTLSLVATSSTIQESGRQIEMLDLLIENGATVGDCLPVIAHGGLVAAEHLLKKGSPLSLPVAVGLDRRGEVVELNTQASEKEKYTALLVSSFFGNEELIEYFVGDGVNVNAFPQPIVGFHSHASALHQAVSSGSLIAVKILVNAGAKLDARDLVFEGTPLQWAIHMRDENTGTQKERYAQIAHFLESQHEN